MWKKNSAIVRTAMQIEEALRDTAGFAARALAR